jgi:steroid delta-isomerase-like uncharacterized protein
MPSYFSKTVRGCVHVLLFGGLACAGCAATPAAAPRPLAAVPAALRTQSTQPVVAPPSTPQAAPSVPAIQTPAPRQRAALQAWIRAYNAHDAAGFAALYAQEAHCRVSSQESTGRAAIEVRMRDFWLSFPDASVGAQRVLETNDTTIVQYALTGTLRGALAGHAATGQTLALEVASVLTWDPAGQVLEEHVYFDKLTLLEQVGLSNVAAGRRLVSGPQSAPANAASADEQAANLAALRAIRQPTLRLCSIRPNGKTTPSRRRIKVAKTRSAHSASCCALFQMRECR